MFDDELPHLVVEIQVGAGDETGDDDDGGAARRFISESWGELKKVEWPTQNQLIQGVAVVLIACLIVGVFLYGCDVLFKHLVQRVFT